MTLSKYFNKGSNNLHRASQSRELFLDTDGVVLPNLFNQEITGIEPLKNKRKGPFLIQVLP